MTSKDGMRRYCQGGPGAMGCGFGWTFLEDEKYFYMPIVKRGRKSVTKNV